MKLIHPYKSFWYLGLLLVGLLTGCQKEKPGPDPEPQLPGFESSPSVHELAPDLLHGASGIVDAVNFDRAVWVHNDHDPHLYLISYEAELLKKIPFDGPSHDWEDMASGPGPDPQVNYLYIAETGDNAEIKTDYFIYRFPEPTEGQEVIDQYDTIHFSYSDGKSYDVETLLLDPLTKDLYLLTKRQLSEASIFKLAYPQNTTEKTTAEFVKNIPYGVLTSGDISRDGKEILLKNYVNIYYWKLKDNETILSALDRSHDLTPRYIVEPQGEGICFDKDIRGFFTISEKGSSADPVKLYHYSKKLDASSAAL